MKTKIEVRAKALELAVKITTAQIDNGYDGSYVRELAELYEKYILGDADLPECEESVEVQTRRALEQMKDLYAYAGLGGCHGNSIGIGNTADSELEKLKVDDKH